MKVKDIKTKILNWEDFYGGDCLNSSEVKRAKTKKELKDILIRHSAHLECMAIDAQQHIDNFVKELDLNFV